MRNLVVGILILLLPACATPDLSGFSKESTKLAALATSEIAEITAAYVEVGSPAQAKSVEASERIVNASLNAMVEYSDALKALSESGERGAEASEEAFGHLDTLAKTIKPIADAASFGLAGSSLEIVKSGVTKISAFVQAYQANQSLRVSVAHAQPAIEGLRDIVVATFSHCSDQGVSPCEPRSSGSAKEPRGQWALAVTAITDARRIKTEDEFGDNIIATVKFINLKRNELYGPYLRQLQESEFAPEKFCVGAGDCIDPDTIETIARLDDRRKILLPEWDAYQAKIAAAEKWQKARIANSAVIASAVQAWASEHGKVAAALEECRFNVRKCRPVDAGGLARILLSATKGEN